ncbi:MAG: hypothetical protein KBA46_03465 [Candidatus Omnitrophica bacterium]|nr:hypothetical protein [Candidatus Omnitrophota bacterium]
MMRTQKQIFWAWAVIVTFAIFFVPTYSYTQTRQSKKLEEVIKREVPAYNQVSVRMPTVNYEAFDLRDPFFWEYKEKEGIPLSAGSQAAPDLSVQGVILSDRLPQVIINDKVLTIGDEFAGAKVLEITRDAVVVLYQFKQFSLPSPRANYIQEMQPQQDTQPQLEGGTHEQQ